MSAPIDLRGLRCPWPVLRLAAAMRDRDSIAVLVDDPAAPDEIAALASARGWRYDADGKGGLRVERTSR